MITNEFKTKVVEAIKSQSANYESNSKMAVALGISAAQFSRIFNGELERVLSDAHWISIARKLGVSMRNEVKWNTAETPVFIYINAQLEHCQRNSISSLLCDLADIGKTHTAKEYVRTHKNAVLIDCSQVKTKQQLVRRIAKEFGVGFTGKYKDVYEDLAFYLRSISNPLIILDEAGDLQYDAFLEVKALWNATERTCGWFMMGADGLKAKIQRSIDCKKVGFTEIFRRYGSRYQRVSPQGKEDSERFAMAQAMAIIKANAPVDTNFQKFYAITGGSLTRIYNELTKVNIPTFN